MIRKNLFLSTIKIRVVYIILYIHYILSYNRKVGPIKFFKGRVFI